MKNKFFLVGLLGVFGLIGGGVLDSLTLWGLTLFFPLLLVFWAEKGEKFSKMLYGCCIRTLIFGLIVFTGVMFIAAILTQNDFIRQEMPFDILSLLYGSSLSWCFAGTICVFVVQVLAGSIWLKVRKER
ncbi:hypothetical protein FACS18949_04700 [Clostridia bacterium]|nr:hypothetical protein FACS189425_08590 [Clostridia bacterium]GHV32754.1 hypothetical protein FACS18949_04700 [Clostridia bacterium]